jgi:hypothetical protein
VVPLWLGIRGHDIKAVWVARGEFVHVANVVSTDNGCEH